MPDWYTVTGAPGNKASLASATIRAEFLSIQNKISSLLPTYTGNGGKVVAVNAGGTGLEAVTSGLALTSPVLTTPQINDTSADHQYVFAVNELSADRTVTLPLLTGNDEFTFNAHAQTLTNKTIDADNNTISNLAHGAEVDNPSSGVHGVTGSVVGTTDTQTLTNKTLTNPVISAIINVGTLTLPTATDTLVGRNTTDTLTNKTLTNPVISAIVNTGTLTLPTATDTLVGRNTTDTLTNKTLTSPVISQIVNTGTLTLPTATDTLVGRGTTDTLTNKTLTSPTINGGTVSPTSLIMTTTITSILDEDAMTSNSASALATQQSIKAYVDSQVTAQDLDFQGDSGGALSIDLDTEILTLAGGDGVTTSGALNTLTIDVDSTVVRTSGTQSIAGVKTFSDAGTTFFRRIEVSDSTGGNSQIYLMSTGTADGDYSFYSDGVLTSLIRMTDSATMEFQQRDPTTVNMLVLSATTATFPGNIVVSGTVDGRDVAADGSTLDSLDAANSVDVTLAGAYNYLTISGQAITLAQIDLATDVTGTLPVANGGTGAATLTDGGVLLGSGTGAITAMGVLASGEMIVGDGAGDPVAQSGATLRSSIGVGTGDSVTFTNMTSTTATITDTVSERTAGSGVTVDGLLIKDGGLPGLDLDLAIQAEKTANFTAVAGNYYPCDTSAGAFTMTFPASPSVGDVVGVIDANGTFATNNLTLGRNGSNVMRSAADGTIDIDNWTTAWVYLDATNGWMPRGF